MNYKFLPQGMKMAIEKFMTVFSGNEQLEFIDLFEERQERGVCERRRKLFCILFISFFLSCSNINKSDVTHTIINGKKNGISTYKDKNDKLIKECYFYNDTLFSECFFDQNGKRDSCVFNVIFPEKNKILNKKANEKIPVKNPLKFMNKSTNKNKDNLICILFRDDKNELILIQVIDYTDDFVYAIDNFGFSEKYYIQININVDSSYCSKSFTNSDKQWVKAIR